MKGAKPTLMKITRVDPNARPMTEEEVRKFLERPHLIRLALVDEDGFPVVYPLWYAFSDDRFWMGTGRDSRKARLLRNGAKAYFSVDTGEAGRAPRGVRGRARVVLHDDDGDRAVKVTLETLARYTGTTQGPMAETLLEEARRGETSVIELVPEAFGTWTYR